MAVQEIVWISLHLKIAVDGMLLPNCSTNVLQYGTGYHLDSSDLILKNLQAYIVLAASITCKYNEKVIQINVITDNRIM